MACIFANRRRYWATQEDIINQIGKKYPNSTICSNYKKLSLPMGELDNHSYIDVEDLKGKGRGRPAKRGKLSRAALYKIFTLVTPVEQIPETYHVGKIEIPPFQVKKRGGRNAWLSPKDMLKNQVRKIGDTETNRRLQNLAKLDNKDTQKKMPMARSFYGFKSHDRPGPIPLQYQLTEAGVVALGADDNEVQITMRAYVVDTREEIDRLGIEGLEERASNGDQPALNRLIQMLSSEVRDEHSHGYIKVDFRMQAAISLGNIGDPEAIPVLRKACNDPATEIRDAALGALGKIEKRT